MFLAENFIRILIALHRTFDAGKVLFYQSPLAASLTRSRSSGGAWDALISSLVKRNNFTRSTIASIPDDKDQTFECAGSSKSKLIENQVKDC